jgi:hypothetical protein
LIDYFAIGLTHGLLALAAWRLLLRDDLDSDAEKGAKVPKAWLKGTGATERQASGDA